MAPRWRKARRSTAEGECVEAAALPSGVGIRDSKHPHRPHLTITQGQWLALVAAVKAGDLGLQIPAA